jgi:hypothetical protein
MLNIVKEWGCHAWSNNDWHVRISTYVGVCVSNSAQSKLDHAGSFTHSHEHDHLCCCSITHKYSLSPSFVSQANLWSQHFQNSTKNTHDPKYEKDEWIALNQENRLGRGKTNKGSEIQENIIKQIRSSIHKGHKHWDSAFCEGSFGPLLCTRDRDTYGPIYKRRRRQWCPWQASWCWFILFYVGYSILF